MLSVPFLRRAIQARAAEVPADVDAAPLGSRRSPVFADIGAASRLRLASPADRTRGYKRDVLCVKSRGTLNGEAAVVECRALECEPNRKQSKFERSR